MNGFVMLGSTYRILCERRKYFESIIKKYKNSSEDEKRKRKIEQAVLGARAIAPYLRNFALIEDYDTLLEVVTLGCTVHLQKGEESKKITILGEADIKFNPKYRLNKEFVAYRSDEGLEHIGKRIGCAVGKWKIVMIEKFKE